MHLGSRDPCLSQVYRSKDDTYLTVIYNSKDQSYFDLECVLQLLYTAGRRIKVRHKPLDIVGGTWVLETNHLIMWGDLGIKHKLLDSVGGPRY